MSGVKRVCHEAFDSRNTFQPRPSFSSTFTFEAQDVPALLKAWEADANWMKKQPGFISTQLHRAIGESCVFLNYAVWESVEHFRKAFTHADFRNSLGAYPNSAVASPHLFQKLAIPNLCVA